MRGTRPSPQIQALYNSKASSLPTSHERLQRKHQDVRLLAFRLPQLLFALPAPPSSPFVFSLTHKRTRTHTHTHTHTASAENLLQRLLDPETSRLAPSANTSTVSAATAASSESQSGPASQNTSMVHGDEDVSVLPRTPASRGPARATDTSIWGVLQEKRRDAANPRTVSAAPPPPRAAPRQPARRFARAHCVCVCVQVCACACVFSASYHTQ